MRRGQSSSKSPCTFKDKSIASAAGKKGAKGGPKDSARKAIAQSPALVEDKTTKHVKRITPEIQQDIRNKLLGQESNGHAFITNFIDAFLSEAKKDPNSQPARMLGNVIFNEKLLSTLDEALNKQMNRDLGFAIYQIRKTLYDKQQDVFDNDTDKIIQCICSRRAGKTELMGRLIIKRLLKPNQHVVYINRSFEAAQRQITKPFETAINSVGDALKITTGTIAGGLVKFDNGSWLLIIGNNNSADVNKIRGESVSLCIIDEHCHMRHIRELIQDVIQPAMMDFADSQMILIGTPPRQKQGFATELWNNPEVKHYHWTFMDNPFIPNKETVIPQACKLNGVSEDSMFIRREYFGDMNAYDDSAMLIKHIGWEEPDPNKVYSHAWIGVDFGFEDKAAVVAVLGSEKERKMWVVADWSEAKKGIVELSSRIQAMHDWLKEKYRIGRPIQVITDTNEKAASHDLYAVYNIPNVCLAYKYDKDYALDQLSDWFSAETIKVSTNAKAIIDDCENTMWERDEETDKIIHEIDDDCWHPNALMALLYVSRQFAYDVMGLRERNKPAKDIGVTATQKIADIMEEAGEHIPKRLSPEDFAPTTRNRGGIR